MKALASLAAALLSAQPAFSAPPSELRAALEKAKVNQYAYRGLQTVVVMDVATYCSPSDRETKRLNREIELAMVKYVTTQEDMESFKELRQVRGYGRMLVEYLNKDLGGCSNALELHRFTHSALTRDD